MTDPMTFSPSLPLTSSSLLGASSKTIVQFQTLPTELILVIYKQFETPAQITTLNLVSRSFYEVWRLNAASISRTVLSHIIECYDAAFQIIETFDEGKLPSSSTDRVGASSIPSSSTFQLNPLNHYIKTLDLNATLISNARKASMVVNRHQRAGNPSRIERRMISSIIPILLQDDPYTRLSERKFAIWAFYRLWCMTSASCCRTNPVTSLSREEIYGLNEMVLSLVWKKRSNKTLLSLGVCEMELEDQDNPNWRTCTFSKCWKDAFLKAVCAAVEDPAEVENIFDSWHFSRLL